MKKGLLVTSVVVVLSLAAAAGIFGKWGANADAALAEFSVQKMTCGSCAAKINDALSRVDGVQQVDIVVTTGRSQVIYNPEQVDAATIARVITDSGYPATVQLDLSSDDYRAMKAEEGRMAEQYLAKVGTRLISRVAFEQRLQQALGTMPLTNHPDAVQLVRTRLWQEVRDREILLAAAESNLVVVQQGEVEYRLKELRDASPDFNATVLAGYDGEVEFMKRLKEDMIIQRNIEDHVISGIDNPVDRRQQLNQWFQQISQQTPVVIFDQQLKQDVMGTGSGCGGGCCSS